MRQKYLCKLQVTENGDLIYNFGPGLRPKGQKSLGEILTDFSVILWKIFKVCFKAWITIMLVVYFVIFLVLLVVLIILSSSGRSSSRKSLNLGWVFRIFIAVFEWKTFNDTITYSRDMDGYRYRQYESKRNLIPFKNESNKNLIASVYDFVFGPPRVKLDPLTNEKEVAAYLREQKGVIVVPELIALAGWTFDRAETCMADYVSRFKGDVEISNNNIMYCRFDRIIRSAAELPGGKIEYYWYEYEPPYKLTGNTGGKNFLIILLNSFNLIMSSIALFSPNLQRLLHTQLGIPVSLTIIGLGIIPCLFSLLFFLVPILRIPYVMIKEKKRRETNKRKRLIKEVFDSLGSRLTLKKIEQDISSSEEKKLTNEEIDRLMNGVTIELRGDKEIDDNGNIYFAFNRIKDDYDEIKRIRNTIRLDASLGKIVMET